MQPQEYESYADLAAVSRTKANDATYPSASGTQYYTMLVTHCAGVGVRGFPHSFTFWARYPFCTFASLAWF